MAKVIKFPLRERIDPEAVRLLSISNELDAVITRHLSHGDVNAVELAAVIAHRLAELLNHVDEKSELWEFCKKVVSEHASVA